MKRVMRYAVAGLLGLALQMGASSYVVTPTTILVDPTQNLQAAIDALPSGSELVLAPGVYTATDTAGFILTKPITIRGGGDGYMIGTQGVVLAPYFSATDSTKNSTVIQMRCDRVQLVNLTITSPSQYAPLSRGVGDGVRYSQTGSANETHFGLTMRNVQIGNMGRDGVHLYSDESGGYSVLNDVLLDKVEADSCMGNGFYIVHCGSVELNNCVALKNYLNGANIGGALGQTSCRMYGCYFQQNHLNTWESSLQYLQGAQVYATLAHDLVVSGCEFEDFGRGTNTAYGLVLNNCRAATVYSCQFLNAGDPGTLIDPTSIYITNGSRACWIGPNAHDYVTYTVWADTTQGTTGNMVMHQSVGHSSANAPGYKVFLDDKYGISYNLLVQGTSLPTDDKISSLRFPRLQFGSTLGTEIDGNAPSTNYEGSLFYNQYIHSFCSQVDSMHFAPMACAPRITNGARDSLTSWAAGSLVWSKTNDSLYIYTGLAKVWRAIMKVTP